MNDQEYTTIRLQFLRVGKSVVAFQAYRNEKHPERATDLTSLSLAATLESLRRVGIGRVSVGIMVEAEFDLAQNAFQVLLDMVEPDNIHDPKEVITQIGHMEVGYAMVSTDHTKSKLLVKNMPRGVSPSWSHGCVHSIGASSIGASSIGDSSIGDSSIRENG